MDTRTITQAVATTLKQATKFVTYQPIQAPNATLSRNNAKMKDTGKRLGIKVFSFDLPAGHTCPAANLCHSRVTVENGKRTRHDYGEFVCYATKAEVAYTNVFNAHWANFEASKLDTFVDTMVDLITRSKADSIRIHSSGDFYTFAYFQKWVEIARRLPNVQFWGYTKMATFLAWLQKNPVANMAFVYSHGGTLDAYADAHNLPQCHVVNSYDNPPAPIICETSSVTGRHDTDDYEMVLAGKSFSLMIH